MLTIPLSVCWAVLMTSNRSEQSCHMLTCSAEQCYISASSRMLQIWICMLPEGSFKSFMAAYHMG